MHASAATKDDFPNWFSPMLVKELRQGLLRNASYDLRREKNAHALIPKFRARREEQRSPAGACNEIAKRPAVTCSPVATTASYSRLS